MTPTDTPDREIIDNIVVWHRPRVTVLSRPAFDPAALRAHLSHPCSFDVFATPASAAERLAEAAGRTCYTSWTNPRPGGTETYLAHILEVGHGSVLEHASFSFLISGVSRTLTHELLRHRAGTAISQLSQRYADQGPHGFVAPPGWGVPGPCPIHRGWEDGDWVRARRDALARYRHVYVREVAAAGRAGLAGTAARKQARGVARGELPGDAASELVWTGNVRAIRHVLEMRCHEAADWEIRRLMNAVYQIMLIECPILFADYVRHDLTDGTYAIETRTKKV